MKLKIKTFTEKTYTLEILYHIGALEDSIHFIFDHESKTCAIVDPAWDPQLFVDRIQDKGYTLTDIWLTHWHFDHTGTNEYFGNDAVLIAHNSVRPLLSSEQEVKAVGKVFPALKPSGLPDITFTEQSSLYFNGEEIVTSQ